MDDFVLALVGACVAAFATGMLLGRQRADRRLITLVRWHHDAGTVHARCGTWAIAEAWGTSCPICHRDDTYAPFHGPIEPEYRPQRDVVLDQILADIEAIERGEA